MSRIARVVVSEFPHHIIQRGNRRQKVFFNESLAQAIGETYRNYTRFINFFFFIIVFHVILFPISLNLDLLSLYGNLQR